MSTGIIIFLRQIPMGDITWTFGIIGADGVFYDWADPRWQSSPAPRDGRYAFFGYGLPSLCWGQKVSFTPNPGSIDVHGANEVTSYATDVQPL